MSSLSLVMNPETAPSTFVKSVPRTITSRDVQQQRQSRMILAKNKDTVFSSHENTSFGLAQQELSVSAPVSPVEHPFGQLTRAQQFSPPLLPLTNVLSSSSSPFTPASSVAPPLAPPPAPQLSPLVPTLSLSQLRPAIPTAPLTPAPIERTKSLHKVNSSRFSNFFKPTVAAAAASKQNNNSGLSPRESLVDTSQKQTGRLSLGTVALNLFRKNLKKQVDQAGNRKKTSVAISFDELNLQLNNFEVKEKDGRYYYETPFFVAWTTFHSLENERIDEDFFRSILSTLRELYKKYKNVKEMDRIIVDSRTILDKLESYLQQQLTITQALVAEQPPLETLAHQTSETQSENINDVIVSNIPSSPVLSQENVEHDSSDNEDPEEEEEEEEQQQQQETNEGGESMSGVEFGTRAAKLMLNVNPLQAPQFGQLDTLIKNGLTVEVIEIEETPKQKKRKAKGLISSKTMSVALNINPLGKYKQLAAIAVTFTSFTSIDKLIDILEKVVHEMITNQLDNSAVQEYAKRLFSFLGDFTFFALHHVKEEHFSRLLRAIDPLTRNSRFFPAFEGFYKRVRAKQEFELRREQMQRRILVSIDIVNQIRQKIDISKLPSLQLAIQLTLIEQDMFCMIRPEEFFGQSWTKANKHEMSPNITAIIKRYNMVSLWVAYTILQYRDLRERLKMLCRFISVAWYCISVRNFNGCFEVIAGLYSNPIYRLKKTWEQLDKGYFEKCEQLQELTSISSNYKNYRSQLEEATLPCLPNIAVHLKDIAAIDDAQKTIQEDNHLLINSTKCDMMGQVIAQLLQYQQHQYMFKPDIKVKNYLWWQLLQLANKEPKTINAELLELSKNIEPPPGKQGSKKK